MLIFNLGWIVLVFYELGPPSDQLNRPPPPRTGPHEKPATHEYLGRGIGPRIPSM